MFNGKQWNYSITGRGRFNPICPSFVTHSVTHNPPAPKGGLILVFLDLRIYLVYGRITTA